MTDVLRLADATVELLGQLQLEGGDDTEAEQGRSPTPRSHVNDFPEVPSEDTDALGGGDGDAGREQATAYAAIDDATDILQRLIDDPQLISALDEDHQERIRVAVQHITKSIAKGELDLDIPLSVKAIIKDANGRTLVLRDAYSEYWDLPGGHVQDGESLMKALRREVKEETSLDLEDAKQTLVKIMTLGEETKPVIFFKANASGHVTCSKEHVGHQWATDEDLGGINLGVFKAVLIPTAQERSEYTSSGTEMPAGERGGDGQLFTRMNKQQAVPDEMKWYSHTVVDQKGDALVIKDGLGYTFEMPKAKLLEHIGKDHGWPDSVFEEFEDVLDDYLDNGEGGGTVSKIGEQSEVVNPRILESRKTRKILRPNIDTDVLETEEDVEQRFDGPKGDTFETEPSVGGRRGVGSGTMGKDIGGSGDTTVGEDVHTPVGGGGRRRRAHKMKLIKTKAGKGLEPVGTVNKMQGRYHLLNGDSEEVLKGLPPESVHCVVTSPSYWGPKMNLSMGELGAETDVEQYIAKLTRVFKETRRVLTNDGSLWIVLGDGAHDNPRLDIPKMLAHSLVKDGWYLQDVKSWDRGRSTPDKFLHLTKEKSYFHNAGVTTPPGVIKLGPGSVDPRSRFAQFPVELGEIAIKYSCPLNGVVMDTFVGTGTALLAARNLGRPGVGIDIDSNELAVAYKRLGPDSGAMLKVQKAILNSAARYDMFVLSKAVGDGRFIVAGYASPVLVDQEGHRITHEALAKDLPRFMADGGKYANVNVMHSNVTVGRIIPEFMDKSGKVWKTEVDDQGLFVVAEIRTDPAAPDIVKKVIEDVDAGRLRSFSISGNADNPTFTCDGDRCFYDINELELYEITLCEEGVNQEAKFDIISKAMTKNADAPRMPEAELLRYFGAWKTLWHMHTMNGTYEVVLYDRTTGEILEQDDDCDLVGDDGI